MQCMEAAVSVRVGGTEPCCGDLSWRILREWPASPIIKAGQCLPVVISCRSTNSASVRTVTSHLGVVDILDSRYLYISSIEQVCRPGGMRQCREIKIKPGPKNRRGAGTEAAVRRLPGAGHRCLASQHRSVTECHRSVECLGIECHRSGVSPSVSVQHRAGRHTDTLVTH